jgi:hypothetical protein
MSQAIYELGVKIATHHVKSAAAPIPVGAVKATAAAAVKAAPGFFAKSLTAGKAGLKSLGWGAFRSAAVPLAVNTAGVLTDRAMMPSEAEARAHDAQQLKTRAAGGKPGGQSADPAGYLSPVLLAGGLGGLGLAGYMALRGGSNDDNDGLDEVGDAENAFTE